MGLKAKKPPEDKEKPAGGSNCYLQNGRNSKSSMAIAVPKGGNKNKGTVKKNKIYSQFKITTNNSFKKVDI